MALTLSGSGITSANIVDGTITNTDINASANIPASKLDHGTTANKMVRLDASGKLPAIDGSALTGIESAYVKTSHTISGAISTASNSWAHIPGASITHTRGNTTIGTKHIITYGLATYNSVGGSGCGFKLQRSYDNSSWLDIYNPADGWGIAGYGGATSDYTSFTYVDGMSTTNSTVYYRVVGRKWDVGDSVYFNYSGYTKNMSFVVQEVTQ